MNIDGIFELLDSTGIAIGTLYYIVGAAAAIVVILVISIIVTKIIRAIRIKKGLAAPEIINDDDFMDE